MRFDPDFHHRRSIRAKGYDYALAGTYFVTLCVQDRACLFGEVVGEEVELSVAGLMVESWWYAIAQRFPQTAIDAYVVMPNHFHGILMLETDAENPDVASLREGRHIGLPLQNQVPVVGADQCVCPPADNGAASSPTVSLPKAVQWFKTMTTNDYMRGVNRYDFPPFRNRLWQRNYYEHIIRDDRDLDRIRDYIASNPVNWANDEENPLAAAQR